MYAQEKHSLTLTSNTIRPKGSPSAAISKKHLGRDISVLYDIKINKKFIRKSFAAKFTATSNELSTGGKASACVSGI